MSQTESSPSAPATRVIAVSNQKGGVGKTTTTVTLGAALADLGYRVLIIDFDPQGNASTSLNFNIREDGPNIYDVLVTETPMEDVIESTEIRNLFIVTSNPKLVGAEIELVPMFGREGRLKAALSVVLDQFDFVFIDCPPSLGLLTVNAMVAATEVMVPIRTQYLSLQGLVQVEDTVKSIAKWTNPDLAISMIVCTMFDARTKSDAEVVTEVRASPTYGPLVCKTVIPLAVRIAEAPSHGKPVTTFDPSSSGARAYRALALEVSGGEAERTR